MIKKLIKFRNAHKVAASYPDYAEFARNASNDEKEVVITEAIKKANELQRDVAAR